LVPYCKNNTLLIPL